MAVRLFVPAYVAFNVYPIYLAGKAPGERITVVSLAALGGGVALSALLGALVRREWAYAVPWVMAVGTYVIDLLFIIGGVDVSGHEGLFRANDSSYSLIAFSLAETAAVFAGIRLRELRTKPT